MKSVNFTRMIDGTKDEYMFLDQLEQKYISSLPDRLLESLKRLENTLSGYRISRLDHSLQSATRAFRASENEQMIIAALLHDIGDELAPASHSELAAAILRPYVTEKIYWIIKHHGLFQMYYYAHHCGGNRNARDRFKDHQWYPEAVHFCENYDQNCFDPDYDSLALDFFEPMLKRVFAQPSNNDFEYSARYGD